MRQDQDEFRFTCEYRSFVSCRTDTSRMRGSDAVIYRIVCLVTKDTYVGSAARFVSRKRSHLSELRAGVHRNKRLQELFGKHGEKSFRWSIISRCPFRSGVVFPCDDSYESIDDELRISEWLDKTERHFIVMLKPSLNINAVKAKKVTTTRFRILGPRL